MIGTKKIKLAIAVAAIGILFFGISTQSIAQDAMKKQAIIAFKKLHNKQKDDGSWGSVFSLDTVPKKFRTELCSWHNLVMVDLLQPLADNYNFDSLLIKSMIYVREVFYDSLTGLVKFGTRITEYPKDSDDTALYWLLNDDVDTTLIPGVIDTLLKYQNEKGLYHIWLREVGCSNLRACGKDPNPTDLLSNIHVYLFLKKYSSDLANELCEAFQNNAEGLSNLWIYNSKTPWLYYIRQIDLEKDSCRLAWNNFDDEIKPFAGQEIYTEMSKLILDLALGRELEKNRTKAQEVLHKVAKEKFKFVKTHPIAMFHNDLTAKKPAYFWSYDIPYALWLRLNHEYRNQR